jgi:hypothetical protein
MNPRHAAALALVGWYLIAPPIRSVEPDFRTYDEYDYDYLDEHAAYRDWKLICVLNTKDECERFRERIKERTAPEGNAADIDIELEQWVEAECFASDDPRIKCIDPHAMIPPRPR